MELLRVDLSDDYPGRALGAILAALGKRVRYHECEKPPFDAWWDHTGQFNAYRMHPDVAAVVGPAIGELRPDLADSSP